VDAIRLSSVSKSYGAHRAVDGLSISVPEGAIFGFIGPNGSGKTTTLRMLLHVIHPDEGTIEVLGRTGRRAANDRIGYLPEERGLYKKLQVGRLLSYYGQLKGMSAGDARDAAKSWLARLGLAEWHGRKVEALSKGMAQKVQFIASVLARPQLLVLDEPFSGLDPVNLEVLREAILALRREGTTVVFSTHDMAMAERMCDSICMIHEGRKVLDGTLASIQAEYAEDTVRLRHDGDADLVRRHPGVSFVRDLGRAQEARLSGDPQALLAHLVAHTRVELFEVSRPSLHDIFVRIAGEEATTHA
jgi:ABC-2 type transport system ATP-binding protein